MLISICVCTASAQTEVEINDWISTADQYYDSGNYEDAIDGYKRILEKRPAYDYIREKLHSAEEELLFNRIQKELDQLHDGEKYLAIYTETGKYYNEVRDILREVYIQESYTYYNQKEIAKQEDVYEKYLKFLGESRSDLISNRIAISAQDSASTAMNAQNWPLAIHYNEKVLKFSSNARDREKAEIDIALATKKQGNEGYLGIGYLYNPQMPIGIYMTKLNPKKLGWYFAFQFNSNFFNNFRASRNFTASDFNPDVPSQQILLNSGVIRGQANLSLGLNYNIYKSIYVFGGLGLAHVAFWDEIAVFRRSDDLGSGVYQGRELQGGGLGDGNFRLVPEVGVEYQFWKHATARYGFMLTNPFGEGGRHNIGISIGRTK